jgi:putative transposase
VSRFARVVIPECPHHVTQRGNGRRDVFFTAADRETYLGLLRHYAALYEVAVLGFCLMTNHVHLVLQPHRAESLAKIMREIQMRYSQYRHALERGGGHLWQSRYYSCAVQLEQLGIVMRYVELNPVRAGLAARAEDYRWSSAAAHVGGPDEWRLLAMKDWLQCWTSRDWAEILRSGSEDAHAIRDATYGGRPFGSVEFVGQLEGLLQRRLRKGSSGRPKKEKALGMATKI